MMSSEIISLFLLIFLVGVAVGAVICAVVIIATEYNWRVKSLLDKLKPERSTPLQKEIKAERKEIERLKQHKRDMKELEELKKQRDQLWEEVHEEEHPTFKGIDPLPHLKNLQRNDFPADDFRYKAMKKQSEHFEEIIQEAEGEIDEVVNHYKKKTYRRDSDEI